VKYINGFIHTSFVMLLAVVLVFPKKSCAQPLHNKNGFTHQDTLRGSIGTGRDWWDVTKYEIQVTPDYITKTIKGSNTINFKWLTTYPKSGYMQIDLQQPMILDSISYKGMLLNFSSEGNAYFVKWPNLDHAKEEQIKIYYHGKPREAINPPWDGGWIWKKDEKGNPWMSVACQGLGASVWYPCKDHQSDEPDMGATLSVTVPDTLAAIGNGILKEKKSNGNNTSTWIWEVKNPINNYNIVPYIGKYTEITDTYVGETEKNLSLDYWVLAYNKEKAKKQFDRDVKRMLKAFEYWFGPYPFYEDGYKLVESPHLGMEHQSATAYGNHYMDGYLGMDLSGTGWGLKWDYIIIHESGHEWFANNITTNDIADMWVHEGFTMYSEVLFIEYFYGKKAADEYVQGLRPNIENDKPLIGPYGVNQEGSGDMYNKGANLLHTIRQIIGNDTTFRNILRGLNKDFYHQTVDSKQVEDYFISKSGKKLNKIFDQYLRTVNIPVLEYKIAGNKLMYRWANVVAGFEMPVKMLSGSWITPSTSWKNMGITNKLKKDGLQIESNFYITVKKVK
jgi:aminopeptidase N